MYKHKLSFLALAVLGMGAAAAGGDDREITGSVDAKALQALRIEAHVGQVDIRVSPKDQISWRLRLEPDGDDGWFSGHKDAARAVAEAKVKAAASGTTFELELELPRGTDFDDVEERWEIEIPARFAVDVEANVGQVRRARCSSGTSRRRARSSSSGSPGCAGPSSCGSRRRRR